MEICPHLRPLVEELSRRHAPLAARHRNWTEDKGYAGWSVYYDMPFEPSLRDKAGLDPKIRYQIFGVTAQYAGFFCDRCSSLVAGANPDYDPNQIPERTPFT